MFPVFPCLWSFFWSRKRNIICVDNLLSVHNKPVLCLLVKVRVVFSPSNQSVSQCFILCLFLFLSKEVFFSVDSAFPYQLITCCVGRKWDIFRASNILSAHSDCLCLPARWSTYWSESDIDHSSQVLSASFSHTSCPLVHQSGIFCIPVTVSCLSIPMLIVDLLVTAGYFPYKSWLLSETTCVPVPVVHFLIKVGYFAYQEQ